MKKIICVCLVLGMGLFSHAQNTWTTQTTGVGGFLNDVAYSGSVYVSVGASGVIIRSTDAISWSPQVSGVATALNSVCFGNGQFVAVGSQGVILTSPNGITWSPQSSGGTTFLNSVRFINGQFIVTGSLGTILTSVNGVTWAPQVSGTSQPLRGIGYDGFYYLISGTGGTILTSPNLVSWTPQTSGTSNILYQIQYKSGVYVAVGAFGTILYSFNAINWMPAVSPVAVPFLGLAVGGGKFVAVGNSGNIITSSDGVNWVSATSNTSSSFVNVVFTGTQFIAAGGAGQISTSPIPAIPVNLSVSANSGSESAMTQITATASTSSPVSGNQTVTLTVTGTNITTGDYTLNSINQNSATITILNGQQSGTATFRVVDDVVLEGTETATLTLSGPSSGITLGSTLSQNITITDNELPVVLTCPINTTTAACQSPAAINAAFTSWLSTASGSGGCNGVLTNNNTGAPAACGGSTMVTFTYTSTCSPITTTCQATFTVASAPPVILTCPTNTTVASCQTQTAVDAAFTTWLATASASGGCSGMLTNNNAGAPDACGGTTTVTFTYSSSCAPLTTFCQASFTVSPTTTPTPSFTNCDNTINLGCNPGSLPSCTGIANGSFGGAVTASNSCGSVPVSCSAGSITVNGCNRSQIFTFTATACGQTSTCTRTYNWTQVTPPSFNGTCGNGVINLGCNPVTLPACDPNVMATNECGPISVTCNVGAITSNGCNRSQTLTYVANAPGCGTFSTCIRIFNWQVTTAPVFANCDNTIDLGCNPGTIPTCANVQTAPFGGAVTASNECGNVSGITCSEGAVTSNGCNRSKVFTFSVTACGFTSTCTRTFTWKIASLPVFDNCTTGLIDLGCNPATLPSCDASVTATSECGSAIVVCTPGMIPSNGCNREQIFTYVATGECGSSTCTRTYVWQESTPVILTCPTNTTVAACQTQTAIDAAFNSWLANASASGGCNGVLTNNNIGAPPACGGSTTVIFTYSSSCTPLTTTCQATFTVASAPPVVLTCPTTTTVNGGQAQAAVNMQFATWLSTASASGGCNGMLTNINIGAPPATGGSTSVTFTYASSCAPMTTSCVSSFSVQQGNFVNTTTNTNYITLQDAINAANAMTPDTIELLDNMDEANVIITNSVVIRSNGFTLTIPSGMLTIPLGRTLTWLENNLVISPGAVIDNDGTLINKGTINYQAGMGSFTNTGYYGGTGSFQGNFVNNGTVNTGN
ncbi:MAG: hypothetical protein IPK46_01355 [Saprospiraceae bacterium]|nr:hypothetical protein [Saprospiraceae bacterium]